MWFQTIHKGSLTGKVFVRSGCIISGVFISETESDVMGDECVVIANCLNTGVTDM